MKKIFFILICLSILLPVAQAGRNGALELHFIDVGYGDSILIRSPAGGYTLIDTGYPEAGGRLLSYLKEHRVTELDHLIMTHPHPDHFGGAVAVLKNLKIKRLWDNGQTIDQFDDLLTRPMGKEYEERFRSRPTYRTLKTGDSIRWGEVTLDILWPPAPLPSPDWNTNSLLIMLRYRDFKALLAADFNKRGEQEILKKEGIDLKADLLKVGHHGAADATGPEFLRAISPRWAVISVGGNPWGYPSLVTIRRLREFRAKVFRTDRDGSINFRYHPDEGMEIMN
jgi:competence protein ComEC